MGWPSCSGADLCLRPHHGAASRVRFAYHIRYICHVQPGETIRRRRLANGLTQQRLAIRAGSSQAAISRLERGEISPTFHTFEQLLTVMGEEAELSVRRSEADYDPARIRSLRARPPAERLAQAISWNLLAGRFTQEGQRARASGGSLRRDAPGSATADS